MCKVHLVNNNGLDKKGRLLLKGYMCSLVKDFNPTLDYQIFMTFYVIVDWILKLGNIYI